MTERGVFGTSFVLFVHVVGTCFGSAQIQPLMQVGVLLVPTLCPSFLIVWNVYIRTVALDTLVLEPTAPASSASIEQSTRLKSVDVYVT